MFHRMTYRPMLEQLETRMTPSVTASLNPAGVLTLTGDAADNFVDAHDDGAGNVTVSYGDFTDLDSGSLTTATFSGVKTVQADMGAGTDFFFYTYDGTNGGIHTNLDVTLGTGSDVAYITSPCPIVPFGNPVVDGTTNITIRTGNIQNEGTSGDFDGVSLDAINDVNPGVHLNVKLIGDDGSDNLYFGQYGGIGAGATVNVEEWGGDGYDFLTANITSACLGKSTLDGEMHWNLDGGAGSDYVQAWVQITDGSASAISSVTLRGGLDVDTVIYYQDDLATAVRATLLGGNDAGDTAYVTLFSGNTPRTNGFPGGVFWF